MHTGGLAAGVPGELRAMHLAWQRHGVLDWKDLFQPAIQLATEGFPATATIANAIRASGNDILDDPGLR